MATARSAGKKESTRSKGGANGKDSMGGIFMWTEDGRGNVTATQGKRCTHLLAVTKHNLSLCRKLWGNDDVKVGDEIGLVEGRPNELRRNIFPPAPARDANTQS